ncbi:MAG: endonuclease/exonuclease/phosphatase family protein [Kiritimatiellae bacterium]|nr:endonuclease/exonuclease/phosphatase family protein [Kiritimatiellia bacterium]
MKRILAWSLFLVLLAGCVCLPPTAPIRVGTYNIRLSPGDRNTANAWDARKADMVQLIRKMDLDAFGLQEVCPDQAQYLREQLPEYAFVGDHREADRKSGEASPVFYRKSRFTAERCGTFWLSETPEVPASKSWKTACTRVCSYLVLTDRQTGKRFCFANTHTDHRSELAREKGMQLIIARMKEFGAGAPIVFTGDHNCAEIETPAKSVMNLLDNALYLSEKPATGPWRTWNGWRWVAPEVSTTEALALPIETRNLPNNLISGTAAAVKAGTATPAQRFYEKCSGPRIDYIYVSPGTRVLEYATHGDPRPGQNLYPSDHFPVSATLVLP